MEKTEIQLCVRIVRPDCASGLAHLLVHRLFYTQIKNQNRSQCIQYSILCSVLFF